MRARWVCIVYVVFNRMCGCFNHCLHMCMSHEQLYSVHHTTFMLYGICNEGLCVCVNVCLYMCMCVLVPIVHMYIRMYIQ